MRSIANARVLATVLAVALGAACSDSDPRNGIVDGDAPLAKADGRPTDAGPGDAGTATSRIGKVFLQRRSDGISGTAFFSGSAKVTEHGSGCAVSQIDACVVTVCPEPTDVPDGSLASAGTLSVSGGSKPVTLTPATVLNGEYEIAAGTDATFAVGAHLSLSASGADVPAFSAESVTVPADIAVNSTYPLIPFDAAFDFAWTGGGADGKVVLELLTDDGVHTADLLCSYDPKAGKGTVPAAALAKMPSCSPAQTTNGETCPWTIEPRDTVSFVAGDFGVDFVIIGGGAVGMFANSKPSAR